MYFLADLCICFVVHLNVVVGGRQGLQLSLHIGLFPILILSAASALDGVRRRRRAVVILAVLAYLAQLRLEIIRYPVEAQKQLE